MPRISTFVLALSLALSGTAALAQGEGESPVYEPYVDHVPVDAAGPTFVPPIAGLPPGPPPTDSSDPGNVAALMLADARSFCAAIDDPAYRIDCLAERVAAAASALPASGPYAESRAALQTAATKLAAVARQNADPAKPRQRYTAPAIPRPITTSRPLTPVREDRQDAANAAAVAILEEAETVLLRSSSTQVAQAPQIQRIAAAVDSNKVLLRST